MCTMRIVVVREMLGTRESGWSLFDGRQLMEKTSKEIKELIKSGKKVCGLTLDKDGELVMDKEGFFCRNILEHRHCGNYKPMVEEDFSANLFYIVIGSHTENEKTVYDCISTRFERLKLTEEDVRAYLRVGVISAGCRLGADNKIELAPLEYKGAEEVKIAELPKITEQLKPEEKTEEKKVEPVKAEIKQEEKKPETYKEKAEQKKFDKVTK